MGNGLGMKSYIGMYFQSQIDGSQGTSGHWLPFVSESISEARPPIEGKDLRNRYNESLWRFGNRDTAGDIVMEADPLTLPAFFMATLGLCVSSTISTGKMIHAFREATSYYGTGMPVQPFKLLIGRDVGSADNHINNFSNMLTLDYAHNAFIGATMNVIGSNVEGIAASTPAFYSETLSPKFDWSQCSLSLDGAGVTTFNRLQIQIMNNLEPVPCINGENYTTKWRRSGPRQVRVSGDFDFTDRAFWNRWNQSSGGALVVTTANTGGDNNFVVDIPLMRFDTIPGNVTGPGVVAGSFTGRGDHDASRGTAIAITAKTNSYEMSTYGAGSIAS